MPPVESKLKSGLLTLGADLALIDVSCQPTNVRLTPGYTEEGDRAEVLCGDVLNPDTVRQDVLNAAALQDFTDPAGLVAWSWEHDLTEQPFVWRPTGDGGISYHGTVHVRALEVGGDVNKRLSTDIAWNVGGDGTATYTPAPGYIPAP